MLARLVGGYTVRLVGFGKSNAPRLNIAPALKPFYRKSRAPLVWITLTGATCRTRISSNFDELR